MGAMRALVACVGVVERSAEEALVVVSMLMVTRTFLNVSDCGGIWGLMSGFSE